MTISRFGGSGSEYVPVQRVVRRPDQSVYDVVAANNAVKTNATKNRAQAAELRQVSSRTADITITTAEGDKVTLSLAAQDGQRTQAYRASGRGEGGRAYRTSGSEQSSRSSSQVNVAVEGNLSEKELADIHKLVESFHQVVQGNAGVGDLAAQFGSLESLSTAKLAYASSQQFSYSTVQVYG